MFKLYVSREVGKAKNILATMNLIYFGCLYSTIICAGNSKKIHVQQIGLFRNTLKNIISKEYIEVQLSREWVEIPYIMPVSGREFIGY